MKSVLNRMFSDSGDLSVTRIMSVITVLSACGIAIEGVISGRDLSQLATLVGVMLGASFAAKVGQNFAEKEEK